jgi:hypothetical protein
MTVGGIVQVQTSNAFLIGMCAVLVLATYQLGPLAMINLYFIPYWINVVWLDIVTYLHHHGAHDPDEAVPWYRGEVMAIFLDYHFFIWCVVWASEVSSQQSATWMFVWVIRAQHVVDSVESV